MTVVSTLKKRFSRWVKMPDRIELLSPAGDLERLKITLLYGADAVYIGGREYSLRANAQNFSLEEIKEACDFAHKLSKKVYLTLNIVFHNEDLEGVDKYIASVVEAGIDAFIVSDPFIISHIKAKYDVEVHTSTQNSTSNIEAVNFLKEEGIDRVVLARELSLSEISDIIDKTGVDIEVFIHGAMCTFYSGRCCLSNYFTNRDANRGGCAQVCRFAFEAGEDKNFTMATNDLNLSRQIASLIEIGVKSLKVEGRMRSLYYLATVIGSYRKIIDAYYENNLDEEILKVEEARLSSVANRTTSTHYLEKEADELDQYYSGRQELSNQEFLGLLDSYEDGMLKLSQRNYFAVGDAVEVFTPKGDNFVFIVDDLYNEKKEKIDVARHPEETIYIKVDLPFEIPAYSMMRKANL